MASSAAAPGRGHAPRVPAARTPAHGSRTRAFLVASNRRRRACLEAGHREGGIDAETVGDVASDRLVVGAALAACWRARAPPRSRRRRAPATAMAIAAWPSTSWSLIINIILGSRTAIGCRVRAVRRLADRHLVRDQRREQRPGRLSAGGDDRRHRVQRRGQPPDRVQAGPRLREADRHPERRRCPRRRARHQRADLLHHAARRARSVSSPARTPTRAPTHATAGWGLFELTGSSGRRVRLRAARQAVARPTRRRGRRRELRLRLPQRRPPADHRRRQSGGGPANGQLIIWFPPFENGFPPETKPIPVLQARHRHRHGPADRDRCAGSRLRERRPTRRRRRHLPLHAARSRPRTRPRAAATAPTRPARRWQPAISKELFIPAGMSEPAHPVRGGHQAGRRILRGQRPERRHRRIRCRRVTYVRKVLDPPVLGLPIPTGHPLGIGLASDGTIYYADIGLVGGSVRHLPGQRHRNGAPYPLRRRPAASRPRPWTADLNFPDGIGILEPAPGTLGRRSDQQVRLLFWFVHGHWARRRRPQWRRCPATAL